MKQFFFRHWGLILLSVGLLAIPWPGQGTHAEEELTFEIQSFVIEGNTLFTNDVLKKRIETHLGTGKTAEDVEAARDDLEKYYHTSGYPTAIVNIPEQSVETGVVRLEVIESKIRRVRVTGNKHFTMEKILSDIKSVRPGEILYVPDLQEELMVVNRNPDLKVAPVLMPGKEVGTIDIEFKVKDKLPLHGSLELNNRGTHNTTDLRLNAMIRYDNLWQRGHSVSLQYQTSPEDTSEVQSISTSYIMPAPWDPDQMLVFYALWSDSDTAFGEGFQVIGKGFIVGIRDIIPLPPIGDYNHNISLGIDYKDFDEDVGFDEDDSSVQTPITYAPISLSYSGGLRDSTGYTQLNASANFLFRGLAGDQDEFENKRYKSTGSFFYITAGIERLQNLPYGFRLRIKGDGQLANEPLISNEQYIAGGMQSVRGYKESEAAGDHAVGGTVEFSRPNLMNLLEGSKAIALTPFLFYDAAGLFIKDGLPGQDDSIKLQGAGGGIRGSITDYLDFEIDAAVALTETEDTDSGDSQVYFSVKSKF